MPAHGLSPLGGDCRGRTGSVDRAGELVADHFAAGGDPEALVRTLARGLLREDADFHTLQTFELARRLHRGESLHGEE